jgi:hypothetical protein
MNTCYYKPGDYIYKMSKSKVYKPLQLYKILHLFSFKTPILNEIAYK